ncbi:hypothetical protein [Liquorilactobacillus nagelii]|uniref:hypothetical protein n=1 Tax=Liquorilactobacillus nagelii TaxID=82688 RepID=UPI0039E870E3
MRYEKGDKVVVEVTSADGGWYGTNEDGSNWITGRNILGKLEDFSPAEEKIKMTVEEKKEFDELKAKRVNLFYVFNDIYQTSKYPSLEKRIFQDYTNIDDDEQMILFAELWRNPDLIEIIEPEKHEVKVGIQNLYLNDVGTFILLTTGHMLKDHFTIDEVKEAEKQLGIQGLQAKWHKAAKGETK